MPRHHILFTHHRGTLYTYLKWRYDAGSGGGENILRAAFYTLFLEKLPSAKNEIKLVTVNATVGKWQ